jgi:hypothetical protein
MHLELAKLIKTSSGVCCFFFSSPPPLLGQGCVPFEKKMADTPLGSPPLRRLPDLASTAQGSPLPAALPPVPKATALVLLPKASSSELKLLPPIPKSPPISRGAPTLSGISLAAIAQEVAKRKEERGVGLLRRLSIDKNWRVQIEKDVDRLLSSRSPVTVEAHVSITGLRDEGKLGYSYDYLGVFPVLVDTLGREYFFAGVAKEFYVRIPRGYTRRQNKTAYTTEESTFIQLPSQMEALILHAIRPPFFPLRYLNTVKEVDGVVTLPTSPPAGAPAIYAIVSDVHSEMEASSHITLSGIEDPQDVINTITAARAAYSRDVREFIVAICQDLSSKSVLDVSEYLQHVWAPTAREWVKLGRK